MTAEQLLRNIIWQNGVSIYLNEVHQREMLRYIRRLIQEVMKLATADQIAALTSSIDTLESTVTPEVAQIQAKIQELIDQASGTADPILDAQIARLVGLRDSISAIIPDEVTTPEG